MPGVFEGTDWGLLQKQKEVLFVVIESKTLPLTDHERTSLQGILHWIDSIQDYQVDIEGATVEEIFGGSSRYS